MDLKVSFLDLNLGLYVTPAGELDVWVIANADLYEPATAERIADALNSAFEAFATTPDCLVSDLELLPVAALAKLAASPHPGFSDPAPVFAVRFGKNPAESDRIVGGTTRDQRRRARGQLLRARRRQHRLRQVVGPGQRAGTCTHPAAGVRAHDHRRVGCGGRCGSRTARTRTGLGAAPGIHPDEFRGPVRRCIGRTQRIMARAGMWAVVTTAPPQIEDVLALSPLQEGLFALYRLSDDDIDLYTMQFVVDIHGPLGVALLRRSASAMLDRYPNLRAAFWDRDVPKPVQIVPVTAELPWAQRVAAPAEFESIARSERGRPFDLGRGPAMRVLLLAVPGENRHRMILTVHHILMDGWALAVFFTEMLAVYRAGGSLEALPAPRPYRDYIVWLAEQDNSAAMARWNDYLCGASGPLLVADGAAGARGGVPGKTPLLLGPADTVRLRLWAAGHGLTLGTAVLFAWTVVLGRLTDREDVVFGTIVSGRPERLTGVESMVGLFINAVPVVHHLGSGASVVAQCARLQRELSAMRDIGHLSLSAIQREHGRGTLFDTLFVFENAPIEDAIRPAQAPDGTRFCPIEMESLTHYPLAVVSHLQDDALVVMVEAVVEALPYLRAADIGERLLAVLRQLPDAGDGTPDVFDVLTPAERAEFCEPAAHARIPADGTTVWEVFERQVRATPDAVALTGSGADHFTYAELHAAAGRIAGELVEHGIGPESVVALVLPRSTGAVVAIWAVLAAGGAYVPVDVALPEARIESILRQANPALVITDTSRSELVGDGRPKLVLDDPAVAQRCSRRAVGTPAIRRHPEHCAYIIFTSGSSGEPKGVVTTNAALLAYFADHRERVYRAAAPHLGRPLRIAHAWSLSFDASWQPMVGLLDGHELHLFDAEEMRDADLLVEGMARSGVDMIDTTPSMLTQLCAAGLLDRDLAVLALGGEPIDSVLWAELRCIATHGGLQLLRPDRNDCRGCGRRGQGTSRADDRYDEHRNYGVRAGFKVAGGTQRRGGRALPFRSAAGPRIPPQARSDRRPVRRRPAVPRQSHVPHR